MKTINKMKIVIDSKSSNESFARTAVAAFIAQLDPTYEEVSDIKTAVSEAVTNCIVHAYKEEIKDIYITVKIFENSRVRITIKDKGCGIEDTDKAREPLYTTSKSGERAGLGFAVMESMCDKFKINSKVAKGTTVTMDKIIKSKF